MHWLVLTSIAACAVDLAGCGSSGGGATVTSNTDAGAPDGSNDGSMTMSGDDGSSGSDAQAGDDVVTNPMDAAGGDAASTADGSSDAQSTDAGDAAVDGGVCTGTNDLTPCVNPGTSANDFCSGGTCGACNEPADDSHCATAYGAGHICVAGACVVGTCHASATCAASTPACVNNNCAACDAPDGNAVVVDPVNGIDIAANGSGTAGGGSAAGVCAFKTITFALAHLGGATTVDVLATGPVSVATNGETFPIVVPANVTIGGSAGIATIKDVASNSTGVAFRLASSGSALGNLLIDGGGTGINGVVATTGASSTVSNVEVKNFVAAGIRAEAGTLAIGAGTNLHNNGVGSGQELSGLHVTATGQVTITGGVTGIQFNHNGGSGILVDSDGSEKLTITGTPTGTGTTGSVVANNNGVAGLEIAQTAAAPQLIKVDGLVAASNTHDGLRVGGGSHIEVRGSVFVGNGDNGVNVVTAPSGTAKDDVSAIDLGTDTATDAGKNLLQSTALPNNGAGVCLNIAANKSQTLNAQGNTWVSGGAAIDCSTTAGTLSESTSVVASNDKPCSGATDIGGTGLTVVVLGTANAVSAIKCTCGSTANAPCK
jgi:hypothetical protein